MDYNDLDDIMKSLGYKKCEPYKCKYDDGKSDENNQSCDIDPTAGASTNYCRNIDSDIIGGFQDIDPMVLLLLAEVAANSIASRLPNSLLNAYGNWLQTIGQVIQTFNSQQQYQQSGPGRYYNPIYRNVTSPYCTNPMPTQADNGEPITKRRKSKKRNNKHSNNEIKNLKEEIRSLRKEIENLKNKCDSDCKE